MHEEFSLEAILELRKANFGAKVIVHPECELPIRMVADFIGSTSEMLQYSKTDSSKIYIVATEAGILHKMKKESPEKIFIPAPPKDSTCGCSECNFMKLITLEKIYNCLDAESPEIELNSDVIIKAQKPIVRMLEISKKLSL